MARALLGFLLPNTAGLAAFGRTAAHIPEAKLQLVKSARRPSEGLPKLDLAEVHSSARPPMARRVACGVPSLERVWVHLGLEIILQLLFA